MKHSPSRLARLRSLWNPRRSRGAREAISESTLRQRLRAGDPATASEFASASAGLATLRQRVLAQARTEESAAGARRDPRGRPSWASLAAAGAACAGVGLGLALGLFQVAPPASRHRAEPRVATFAGGAEETRRIDFTTTGGTRIIWVIDPRFELP